MRGITPLLLMLGMMTLNLACQEEERDRPTPKATSSVKSDADDSDATNQGEEDAEQEKQDKPEKSSQPEKNQPTKGTKTEAGDTADSDVYRCSYDINGKKKQGETKEECDALEEEFEAGKGGQEEEDESSDSSTTTPGQTNEQFHCEFNINGEVHEGNSRQECEQLEEELGIDLNIP